MWPPRDVAPDLGERPVRVRSRSEHLAGTGSSTPATCRVSHWSIAAAQISCAVTPRISASSRTAWVVSGLTLIRNASRGPSEGLPRFRWRVVFMASSSSGGGTWERGRQATGSADGSADGSAGGRLSPARGVPDCAPLA